MATIVWLVAVVLFVGFLLVGAGCTRHGTTAESRPPVVRTAEQVSRLDREQVRQLLQRVAKVPPPTTTKIGAMCYKPANAPQRAEYACPKCGERTLYEDRAATLVEWEVNRCRREFAELKKVADAAVVLDESQLCRQCCPEGKPPAIVLRLVFDDGTQHVVEGVTANDVRLVREFLAGNLLHIESNDAETPLQQHLPRLKELLGEKSE
jgi:ribosomal protein L37AE/L43A